MKVDDVMTREVVAVAPGASLKEAAHLLVAHRISGLPVVDRDGRVIGVVSERDLLFKERGELGADEALPEPLAAVAAANRRKLEAHVVGEVMTTPAWTIEPQRTVAAAAKLLLDADVHRLPVVAGGRLVGVVSRADLVRAFTRSDAEIAREIREDVLVRTMRIDEGCVAVEVADGEVTLTGTVETHADAAVLPTLVAKVPGVVDVRARLHWSDVDPEC
jgi:CBS domain-containing protein